MQSQGRTVVAVAESGRLAGLVASQEKDAVGYLPGSTQPLHETLVGSILQELASIGPLKLDVALGRRCVDGPGGQIQLTLMLFGAKSNARHRGCPEP